MKKILLISLTSFAAAFLACSNLAGGSGTDIPDSRITGMVTDTAGLPMANTAVTVIPITYNPMAATPLPASYTDTTGTDGSYAIDVSDKGSYRIQAVNLPLRTRLLVPEIQVIGDTTIVPSAKLQQPGTLRVMLPTGISAVNCYVYIPGTTIGAITSPDNEFVQLDSVPAGIVPAIYYAPVNKPNAPQLIKSQIPLSPGGTSYVIFTSWKYSQKLAINTSVSGANVMGTVVNFPLLVRLSSANFPFAQAKAGGDDLRFTKSNNAPLPFEIEQWDAAQGKAAIWVRLDTVYGDNNTQYITLHWGNPDAASGSNGGATFDTARGFQGVWHLGEAGNTTANDATWNRFNGTPYHTSVIPGMIGNAHHFDGATSFIVMPGTAAGKLDFPTNGVFTVSAWAWTDTIDQTRHMIASKGDNQFNLEQVTTEWEFSVFENMVGWNVNRGKAASGVWTLVSGVRSGNKQYLYINGMCMDSSYWVSPYGLSRYTGFNFMIGKTMVDWKTNQDTLFFKGKIDEVRVMNFAPGEDWFKLSFMNQNDVGNLVEFKH